MGFRINETQQISLNDRLKNLTVRERKILDNSWAKPFGDYIFPLINEERFMPLFCVDNGRPPSPVNVVVGSLLLQEMQQLNDEEMLESVLLDIRFQYALRLTSFDEMPVSDRTLSRFRARLYEHEMDTGEDLLKEEIESLAEEYAKRMSIKGTLKRMDSLMISSSCKRMGRLELMYTCVSNLVSAIIASNEGHLLPEHLHKYADESNKNAYCYRLKKDDVQTRLEALKEDALLVYELCSSAQGGTDEFQLLERMLNDQTKEGQLKPNKDIKPTSLQNPSDEDATFRRKNGVGYQGYVGNVVEDCGENGNIITKYDFDVNLHSDSEFAAEVIEKLGVQEERTVIVVDGAYPSEANIEAAKLNNIELVPSALSGAEPNPIVNEFQIKEETITRCPTGNAPISSDFNEEKETIRACFDRSTCENCPLLGQCPVKIQKRQAVVTLTITTINRAALAEAITTEEYKELARKRNGVEGIPSVMRRRYGVDDMPVRGLVRSKMRFGFKIGAINAKRVIKFIQSIALIYFFKGKSMDNFTHFIYLFFCRSLVSINFGF